MAISPFLRNMVGFHYYSKYKNNINNTNTAVVTVEMNVFLSISCIYIKSMPEIVSVKKECYRIIISSLVSLSHHDAPSDSPSTFLQYTQLTIFLKTRGLTIVLYTPLEEVWLSAPYNLYSEIVSRSPTHLYHNGMGMHLAMYMFF